MNESNNTIDSSLLLTPVNTSQMRHALGSMVKFKVTENAANAVKKSK